MTELSSYHNHSRWSDGVASPEEMYRAAKAAGVREFGLSDHWVIPPGEAGYGAATWRLPADRLAEYVSECRYWKERLDDANFTIRIGLEVDYFEENHQEVLAGLENYPFDYLIGAVHYQGTFPIDQDAKLWQGLSDRQIAAIWDGYWRKIAGLARTRRFSFVAHLDLPKKFFSAGCYPAQSSALSQSLRVLQECDLALELNTAGWAKPCGEPYPALPALSEARQLGLPVLINADAHHPGHVCRFFPEARQMLKEAGYQQVCTFQQRQRILQPLQ